MKNTHKVDNPNTSYVKYGYDALGRKVYRQEAQIDMDKLEALYGSNDGNSNSSGKGNSSNIVASEKETGIKMLAGKGIEVGEKYYKYEIKLISKGMSHYRILGNIDEKTGHIIFERFVNPK